MVKFLWVGDVHAADTAPSKRTDAYREDILRKVDEVIDLAISNRVDALVFAGDIFHYKEPRKVSHRLVQELCAALSRLPLGVPVYILVGNHDITSGRLESLEKQPLGVLGGLKHVHLLTWEPAFLDSGNGIEVCLHPIPGVPNIVVQDYAIEKQSRWDVLLVHQSIVPDKSKEIAVLQNKPFIHDASEVAAVTDADLVLYGHQHRRDGIYKKAGKEFVNLGSISRGTIGDEDLNKEPAVLLVEMGEKSYSLTEIKLKNVRPAEECFRLEEHFEQKAHSLDIEEAVARLKDTAMEDMSIESVMADIEQRDDIDQPVKTKAIDLLELVK